MIEYPVMDSGRKFVIFVLAVFLLWACAGAQEPWHGVADAAGNPVSSPVRAGSELFAVWRMPQDTPDKIAFQFFFKDAAGEWKLIFLNIQKPDRPARVFRENLAAKDLPPGSYKIVFIRNDEPVAETVFEILPAE